MVPRVPRRAARRGRHDGLAHFRTFDPRIVDRPVPTGDLGRLAPVIEVPLAYHHAMLDQPLPLVTGVRTLLADWDHSVPERRAQGVA